MLQQVRIDLGSSVRYVTGDVVVRGGLMLASLWGAWLGLAVSAQADSNPEWAGHLSRFEFVETHMGSSFKIVLYSTDEPAARRASQSAFDRIAGLDSVLSDYQPDSELSRLSEKAGGPPVPVSADLFDVLHRSKEYYDRTGGAFDVTIAPVGRLWRRARRERKLPDPSTLAEALKLVGSDKMVLDPSKRTIQLTRPGMRLDVGGIAKGYASQAAVDVLRRAGIDSALVAGAGDIVVSGAPPGTEGWTIGVASLNPADSGPVMYLLLKNAAISTSGDAERFVIIGGHRYSHIVNPATGRGVEDRASVTVIAPDGGAADALETSVYLLGPERGLKLIEETPGTAALYRRLTPDGVRTFESSRFKEIPRTRPKDIPGRSTDRAE
jgi:thiamine biosynthesis lipoprotein